MCASDHRRVVLQFEIILGVEGSAALRAAGVERPRHMNLRAEAVGDHLVGAAVVLEARFVDVCAQNGGFRDLHGLVGVLRVVTTRTQIEATDAGVLDV